MTGYIKFELGIRDFGCGIPEDKLDGLFINFNNLEEHRKTNPTGRGLGLSICKSIVEQMGGTVHVQSKVGQGSTFSIIYKAMCRVQTDSPVIRSKPKDKSNSVESVNKPRVLIANDEVFLLTGY